MQNGGCKLFYFMLGARKLTDNTKNNTKNNLSEVGSVGHRARVREKFLKSSDLNSFQAYELIELLLFYCNPRSDVKPLAKSICAFFDNSIHLLLNAPQQVFANNFDNLGDSFFVLLKLVKEMQSRNLYEALEPMAKVQNLEQLVNYLRIFFNEQQQEVFRAMFLNAKGQIIAEKTMSQGTINQAAVYPREIVKHCLNFNACFVIVSHNHPSGDSTPSKEDLQITLDIKFALKTIDVELFDSLVITQKSYYSFKEQGCLT